MVKFIDYHNIRIELRRRDVLNGAPRMRRWRRLAGLTGRLTCDSMSTEHDARITWLCIAPHAHSNQNNRRRLFQ